MSETSQSSRAPRGVSADLNDSTVTHGNLAFVKLLCDLPIFSGLDVDELDLVAGLFRRQLIQPDQIVFDRKDMGEEAYVIVRGAVRITLENGKPIGTFQPGQIFGELAFLDGETRGATAKALDPTILLVVNRGEFEDLADSKPNIGRIVYKNIARELTTRLRRMNAALESAMDSWETAMFRKAD